MGKGAKEKDIKPHGVKSENKTIEDGQDEDDTLWLGQQPNEIGNVKTRNGVQQAGKTAKRELISPRTLRTLGTEAHKSSRDKEDTQKVTSFQIFADADGTKYLGTVHAHNDGTVTVRLKGQKKFKTLGSGSA
ncbi:hypothetical protein KC330_g1015 [Hortaea werneckii]|nr:hypothetical protein KC330_g1015 [Hortaea werneckii]